jgi:hypothetical protein
VQVEPFQLVMRDPVPPTLTAPFTWSGLVADVVVYPLPWQSPQERLRWLLLPCSPLLGGAPWHEVQLMVTCTLPFWCVAGFTLVCV